MRTPQRGSTTDATLQRIGEGAMSELPFVDEHRSDPGTAGSRLGARCAGTSTRRSEWRAQSGGLAPRYAAARGLRGRARGSGRTARPGRSARFSVYRLVFELAERWRRRDAAQCQDVRRVPEVARPRLPRPRHRHRVARCRHEADPPVDSSGGARLRRSVGLRRLVSSDRSLRSLLDHRWFRLPRAVRPLVSSDRSLRVSSARPPRCCARMLDPSRCSTTCGCGHLRERSPGPR